MFGFDHDVGDAERIVSRRIDGTVHGELPPGPPLLGKIPAVIHLPSGFPIDEDRAQGFDAENPGRQAVAFIGEEKTASRGVEVRAHAESWASSGVCNCG